jgi:hypothetical protein
MQQVGEITGDIRQLNASGYIEFVKMQELKGNVGCIG